MKRVCLISYFLLAISCLTSVAQRTIQFSDLEWFVKDGFSGPGPNYWSDSSHSVWVDSNGFLHLKIRKVAGVWHCAEIYSVKEFGYGEYKFHVATNLEDYAANVIAGLFLYENDSSEIDIEFPNRGSHSLLGWYTVQPGPYSHSNHEKFALNLSGSYSTHSFIWKKDLIEFESYHGHADSLPGQNHLINRWTYVGQNIPKEGKEHLHLNLWLDEGKAPGDQKEVELVINYVHVYPEETSSPNYYAIFENAFPFYNQSDD
ncbi:glycoside hydrolase family 16 protein [Mangrovibacterium diazotrophicum]|uniref:Glycosyl hydrolase family 16 n=1 Tax=Mangrovibacterium diazotrophicum TaxID=1261403 RepID=A0A419VWI8_9BACT|nr:glycoside hydrolase family 16 protein [Mangrovibacterium diazotrophicum]RKD86527.1 glycosyl hydrolase family 16 [Mangrovibacterium diazotrophicum]